jgi:TonB family protein
MVLPIVLWGGASARAEPPETSALKTAAPAQKSPAMAEAEANVARVKKPPRLKTQVEPAYPESERALGHAGWVTVRGIIGVDGRMTEAVVARSSAGPVLDASALVAAKATLFSPATDAQGVAISVVTSYRIEFSAPPLSPTYVKRVDAAYPDAERLAGHFGKVIVAGKIGPDGRLTEPVVKQSSRAPGLDAAALEAAKASEFRPYKDEAGNFIAAPVEAPFNFDSIHSPGKGGGILRYHCQQFALDETWWSSVWPADAHSELYTMFLGIRAMAMLRTPSAPDAKTLKSTISDFNARWASAVETCRSRPDALMVDVLKPEGDWAKRMAQDAK